jgi:hypothetical protein
LPVRRRRVLWCWCPLRSQFTPAQSPLKLKLIVDDLRMTRDDTKLELRAPRRVALGERGTGGSRGWVGWATAHPKNWPKKSLPH